MNWSTDESAPWPIDPVTPDSGQTPFDMTRGIPSLAKLQQYEVERVIHQQGNGTSDGIDFDDLKKTFPQMQGGAIVCNEYCAVNQYKQAVPAWSSNNDFLTVTVGFDGQVCGIHAAGPYLVECIGPNDNYQLNYPPGLQAYVIEAGQDNTCVITLNHTVLCWGGLDSQGELDPPMNFTDGSMIVESIHCRSTACCGIGYNATTPWLEVKSNSLQCWGLAAFNNFLGDGLVIPSLAEGVRWVEVVLSSTQENGMFGLGLDSEGKVWNLPCVAMAVQPSVVPTSLLFPMIHISIGDHVGCGIMSAANDFQAICFLTIFSPTVLSIQEYNMIHYIPSPPSSLFIVSLEFSELTCFGVMCAGVVSNVYNNIVTWGSTDDHEGTAPSVSGNATYLPPQANVLEVSLGHDQGCFTFKDGRFQCFSTDPTIPYDSMDQLETFIWENYQQSNPFAQSYGFGDELIQSMQFAQMSIHKGLLDCTPEYVAYLSSMSNVGCSFPAMIIPNTTTIPAGGFYFGALGPNSMHPNFTVGASVKRLETAAGYMCYLDVNDAVTCISYETQMQGVIVNAPNLDPQSSGPAQRYKSLAVGQGFYCMLRLDDSLWCNNATVSAPGLGLNPSLDVHMYNWTLPQWSTDPAIRSTKFSEIKAGDTQLCAIYQSNQAVVCWGYYVVYNRTFLGTDRTLTTTYPIHPIPDNLVSVPFSHIAPGVRVTCGLIAPWNNATCWGMCDAHQCEVPLTVMNTNYNFSSLSVGSDMVCGITNDDTATAVCWGRAFQSVPNPGTNVHKNVVTANPLPRAMQPLSPIPSTVGNFAPLNTFSVGASIRMCPKGTFSTNAGSRTSLCSGGCNSGTYSNKTPLQATLETGSATVQASICPTTANCPTGSFCPSGVALPIPCASGLFGSVVGLKDPACSGSCIAGFYCERGTNSATQYPCPAGRYGNATGLTNRACSGVCDLGYYCLEASRQSNSYICPNAGFICPIGSGSPHAVEAGNYSYSVLPGMKNGQGMTNELPCPIGSSCVSGVQTACAPGTYSNQPGASVCTACEPGRFANTKGATSCEPCLPGTYSNSTGTVNCLLCPSGSAAANKESLSCDPCPAGTASLGGESTCAPCPPETYAPSFSSATCAPCTPPNSVGPNKTDCLGPRLCQPGHYAVLIEEEPSFPSGSCRPCAPGTYSNTIGAVGGCSSCPINSYTLPVGSTSCVNCPTTGFQCNGQNGIGLPMVMPTYYGWVDEDFVQATACPIDYCTGQNYLLAPDLTNSSTWNVSGIPSAVQAYLLTQDGCAMNRDPSSVLCGKCLEGFVEWRGSCVKCDSLKVSLLIAFIAITFIFVCILHLLAQRGNGDTKVFFFFVQSALLQLGSYDTFLGWMGILNFDITQASGNTCIAPLSPFEHIAVEIFLPLLLIVELIIIFFFHRSMEICCQLRREEESGRGEFGVDAVVISRRNLPGGASAGSEHPQLSTVVDLRQPLAQNDSLTPLENSLNSYSPVKKHSLKVSSAPVRDSVLANAANDLPRSRSLRSHSSAQDRPEIASAVVDRSGEAVESRPWELNQVLMEFAEEDVGVFDKPVVKERDGDEDADATAAVQTEREMKEEMHEITPVSELEEFPVDRAYVASGAEGGSVSSLGSTAASLRRAMGYFPSTSTAFFRTLLSLFLFSFQHLTASCLHYFECVSVRNQRVLFSTPSVDCDSGEYKLWYPYIVTLLVLDIIVGPIFLFVLLFRHRKIILAPLSKTSLLLEPTSSILFRARFSLFYESYKGSTYLWQVFVLVRQIVAVGLSLQQQHSNKYLSFCLFNCFNLLLHVLCKPYLSKTDNRMEGVALQLLLLLSIIMLAFQPPYSNAVQIILSVLVIPFTLVQVVAIIRVRVKRMRKARSMMIKPTMKAMPSN